jgi:hypothetical protein
MKKRASVDKHVEKVAPSGLARSSVVDAIANVSEQSTDEPPAKEMRMSLGRTDSVFPILIHMREQSIIWVRSQKKRKFTFKAFIDWYNFEMFYKYTKSEREEKGLTILYESALKRKLMYLRVRNDKLT